MNAKRWFALLGAAVLFLVSIVIQVGSTMATSDFEKLFAFGEFEETVIEEGSSLNKIAVIPLDGIIMDTGGNPLVADTYDHQQFLTMLDEAAEDEFVEGIILRVNTPGGGVVESAEIYDKVVTIQEEYEKPVYVSMGNMAASGGYYVAAPAEKIVAHDATVTGSIGVIMENMNYKELADKLGIDYNTIKSGAFKDMGSGVRDMTKEEREMLQTMIDEFYDGFVEAIVNGRGMSEDRIRELGDGRIYTGKQAKDVELIDELGTLDDTITLMKEDYDLGDVTVVEYGNPFNYFNRFMGGALQNIAGKETDLFGVSALLREMNAPRAMYLYSK
ncbi:MAG TPA: signal peptide peptidase SppA [Bacillota bacterium]|nr:signal peptide peptidase SppA [Bacillota bacterium]